MVAIARRLAAAEAEEAKWLVDTIKAVEDVAVPPAKPTEALHE